MISLPGSSIGSRTSYGGGSVAGSTSASGANSGGASGSSRTTCGGGSSVGSNQTPSRQASSAQNRGSAGGSAGGSSGGSTGGSSSRRGSSQSGSMSNVTSLSSSRTVSVDADHVQYNSYRPFPVAERPRRDDVLRAGRTLEVPEKRPRYVAKTRARRRV
jgi:hypothetical protein